MAMTLVPDALLLPAQSGGVMLVSWWKPLIVLAPIVPWAWLISTVYDKHAFRFHLGREKWNSVHLSVGLAAIVLALGVPAVAGLEGIVGFIVAFAIMLAVLGIDIAVYPMIANKDERVPPEHRVKLDFSKLAEARAAKAEAKSVGSSELILVSPAGSKLAVPEKGSPEFEARVAAEQIVIRARAARASQVDVMPAGKDQAYAVSMLVDGVRPAPEPLPANDAVRLIDIWKTAAGLDVQDRRKRQQADMTIIENETKHNVRLTTIGGQGGMRLSLVFEPKSAVRRGIKQMGLLAQQMDAVKAMVEERQGVVLLAAPADNGRTTMMYTLVKLHDAYTSNVQTIEIEVQDDLEGARQNVFNAATEGAELDKLVRSTMRRDPDVVGIAELDAATALEITRADHERTRTYVSLKAGSAMAAIDQWVKLVGDPEKAAGCLHGVIAGRLLRKLCDNCKTPYQPSADMLKKLGLPADKVPQLFKKGGQVLIRNKPEICTVCAGVGYAGQEGIFEVHPIGAEERSAIAGGNVQELRGLLRKSGLPTMQQAALRKAVDGITSVEEVVRVTSDGAKPADKQPKTSPAAG